MNSKRDALIKVSDPPYCHSVHTSVGDMWRGPTRRLIKKHFGAGLCKTDDKKISTPLRCQEIDHFSGLTSIDKPNDYATNSE